MTKNAGTAASSTEWKDSKNISSGDLAFYHKVSPVIAGTKIEIPPPTLGSAARARRRFAFINQLYVYSRGSSSSGRPIFSQFPEEAPFPVYENERWWSEEFDARAYGRPFDFSRPFFEQFAQLSDVVPRFARMVLNVDNCDYCNNLSNCRNCYFVFNTRHAEDCFNCENVWGSRDCLDTSFSASSELCYDCVTCNRCYDVQSSLDCESCRDSYYLLNCRSCTNCFGCVNLRHKQYYIFNIAHSKQWYFKTLAGYKLGSYRHRAELEARVLSLWQSHPRPHAVTGMAENSSGNYLFECRNVNDSVFVRSAENLRYCFNLFEQVRDCQDYSAYGDRAELVYESARCGNGIYGLLFCFYCYDGCANLMYCSFCVGCEDCFGCIGLRKKRYCIFNEQYEEAAYFSTVARIIAHMQKTGEWGEFFPMPLSPFPFNHSFAQRYFPLTPADAEREALWWYEKPLADARRAVVAHELPDDFPEDDESLVIASERSGSAFLVSREEVKRRRRFQAPLPRTTYDERMNARAEKMGGFSLFERSCAKTGKALRSTFPESSPWIIWDREEYEREFSS